MKYGNLNYFNKLSYKYFGFLLDTGSTLSHFPDEQRVKIYSQVQQICRQIKNNCRIPKSWVNTGCFLYNFTQTLPNNQQTRELDQVFPIFNIYIGQQIIEWHPRNMFSINSETQFGTQVCLGLSTNGQNSYFLMGDNFLRERKVRFNLK